MMFMKVLEPHVKGNEDTAFGFILGSIYADFAWRFWGIYRRTPNDEEIDDFLNIIMRRAGEIKSKVREITNL